MIHHILLRKNGHILILFVTNDTLVLYKIRLNILTVLAKYTHFMCIKGQLVGLIVNCLTGAPFRAAV